MYKRVLIKLSGEALAGDKKTGLDNETVHKICSSIKKIYDLGTEIAIVVGGGNFWRGRSSGGHGPHQSRPHRNACNRYELAGSGGCTGTGWL